MTDTYSQWAARHPQAAADLHAMIGAVDTPAPGPSDGTEAWAQQRARFSVAHQGGMAWRNNVGATPAKCPDCGAPQRPVRYGLANDSAALNKQIKSSDLICAIPRTVNGVTIAQFGAIECKRPGWRYTGKGEEPGQAAWLALVARLGGFATFTTGDVEL